MIETGLNTALAVLRAYLDDAAAPIAKVIAYPVTAARTMLEQIALALSETSTALIVIKRTFVPHLIAVAVASLRALMSAVQLNLEHLISAVETVLLADIAAARDYALRLARSVEVWAQALISAVETRLLNLISAVEAHVLAVISAVETRLLDLIATQVAALIGRIAALQTWTAAQVQHALAFTAQRFAQAEADIITAERAAVAQSIALVDGAVTRGLSDVWGDVTAAVAGAEGVIASDFPDILAGLRAIPRAIPADVAGEAVLAGAGVIALTRYLEQCGIPNCRNLSKYGRDLRDLLGLIEGADFLAWLLELAHDPAGAAREVDGVLGGITRPIAAEARSLFGVG
jgi:hypothetical protein